MITGQERLYVSSGGDGTPVTLKTVSSFVGDSFGTLLSWAQVQNFQLASATRDTNGAITTAVIKWPDGVSGVFTTDVASTAFPGAIDAWHATYAGGPVLRSATVTQPAVTRDANGAVTVQPAITIS